MELITSIWRIYKPFRVKMMIGLVLIFVQQGLNLASPYLQGKAFNMAAAAKPFGDTLTLCLWILALWLVSGIAVMFVRDKFELKNIDFAIPQELHDRTARAILNFSIGQHTNENSGIKLSIITRGKSSLATLAQKLFYELVPMVFEVTIMIGALLWNCWQVGIINLFGLLTDVIYHTFVNKKFRDGLKKQEELHNRDDKFQKEIIENMSLVLANNQEERIFRESHESQKRAFDFSFWLWNRYANYMTVANGIIPVTRFLVLAYIFWRMTDHRMTGGDALVYLLWTANAMGKVQNFGHMQRQVLTLCGSVRKYFGMINVEPDVKLPENPISPERFAGAIEFKNVTFSYNGPDGDEKKNSTPALIDVSFKIEAGETVAFVGESGSGKSTIVFTFLRAQDIDSGQILIDGCDLRGLDYRRLRQRTGIVQQFVPLFDETIGYNIKFGLNGCFDKITEAEMMSVARMACIDRFYGRLEHGFDTYIGERGIRLSGGEQQRVGIARALIKDPDILIFDEATSNLDSENEMLIRKSIEEAAKGRTTIIIAHRFSTIRRVNKIIVLDKGRVVGIGSHKELSKTCHEYNRLVRHQQLEF